MNSKAMNGKSRNLGSAKRETAVSYTHLDVYKRQDNIEQMRRKVKLRPEIKNIEENGATLSGGEKKKLLMLKWLLNCLLYTSGIYGGCSGTCNNGLCRCCLPDA